jgi:hypothetical protein
LPRDSEALKDRRRRIVWKRHKRRSSNCESSSFGGRAICREKSGEADLQVIDAAILANSSERWLKVARVMAATEKTLSERYPGLSYVFYAQRLIHLVEERRLESQGDLRYMRFSEVRIPVSLTGNQ